MTERDQQMTKPAVTRAMLEAAHQAEIEHYRRAGAITPGSTFATTPFPVLKSMIEAALEGWSNRCSDENEAADEIDRLRGWLEWIAVDDTDAQAALRGDPVRTVSDR